MRARTLHQKLPATHTRLRNGRLNQTAYSLFLFIRDVADGDLVTWIDRQLAKEDFLPDATRLRRMREAVIFPMSNIYGVSHKVLNMTMSDLLIGARNERPLWFDVGASMIAIDTLVHNFLHRTGIIHEFGAAHRYGAACYKPDGCADAIESLAAQIDARQFNRSFPENFPRFIQHAIWRYCAQGGLGICNGNRIDDRQRCENRSCRLFDRCERRVLSA